jgi:hypothetical protein
MPLDLSGFNNSPQQWGGLYQAANNLEKRKLRTDQLAAQQQSKRASAGAFLQNYLDPKDLLTGTQFDPMILDGLQSAMQQGAQLAAAGADSPTLMMALGPMVNRLTKYSTNAKNINKQVDDQITKMKESGHIGYDYGKIKEEALKNAFYKTDANGQMKLDPDQADPSVDWVTKAIQASPEKVTTSVGWDTFADKAKMKDEPLSVTSYDKFGKMNKHEVNVKYQEYMVPEHEIGKDGKPTGKIAGFVPKYQTAVDNGQPIMHTFNGKDGKPVKAPVRVVDEALFDGLPQGLQDNIKGQVKLHLGEFETATGEKIPMGSPRAKLVARALAYDELNRPQRNFGTKGFKTVNDKPSPQSISLNIGGTEEFLDNARKKAEAQAEGRLEAKDKFRSDAGTSFTQIIGGNPQYLQGDPIKKGGKEVYDVTGTFPGGGLKAGTGANYQYGGIFFNPRDRSFLIEKEMPANQYGQKTVTEETIQEKDFGSFLYKLAKSNGMSYSEVEQMLKEMGYKGGKFTKTPDLGPMMDHNARQKGVQGWNSALKSPLGPVLNTNQ